MRININELKKLIRDEYRNNYTWFAEEIGVDRSYFTQIMNHKKTSNSNKTCSALIELCEKKGLDYKKYIFLD